MKAMGAFSVAWAAFLVILASSVDPAPEGGPILKAFSAHLKVCPDTNRTGITLC
jgi:hypothetical protein